MKRQNINKYLAKQRRLPGSVAVALTLLFCVVSTSTVARTSTPANSRAAVVSTKQRGSIRGTNWKFCLPPDVKKTDQALGGAGNRITVENILNGLKAKCYGQKLLSSKRLEIRFVHALCWGNPPADADEQAAAQTREIAELRKKFTVILLVCDPLTQ